MAEESVMARTAVLLLVFASILAGQQGRPEKPPRHRRPAAWSTGVRARLAEAKEALRDARKSHRVRLEETRAEGSRRKPANPRP